MLQADKQVLLAGVKRNALELRQRELEFHVERYTNLATQASVVAGFSFESLVELEVPEGTNPLLSSFYFVFGSAAMALALYVLCVASFACVFGHRLALQGPHGSLEKAVHILIDHRVHIFATAGASLCSLVCAAVLMAWIKMGLAASVVSLIFITFGYAVASRMYLMLEVFKIPDDELVTGATRVQNPDNAGAVVDLSRLNPASRTASAGGAGEKGASSAGRPSTASYHRLNEGDSPTSSGALPQPQQPPQPVLQHEGHLFKRGEQGFLSSDATKRRYFVLRGFQLYYFKTWEDFGAGGMKASINADHPIDLRQHEPVVVREEGGKPVHNRFDLVPTSDPLGRRWQLQAASANEASDWLMALDAARTLEQGVEPHAGRANVIH